MAEIKRPSFGTGGIRAVMGEGFEHFNAALVREASLGAALWAREKYGEAALARGVIICRDTRLGSEEFALEAARVFGSLGFRARLFERETPTPLLSYAIRELGACCGVSLTASHNPPQYNGYKLYNDRGVQLTPADTSAVAEKIALVRSDEKSALTVFEGKRPLAVETLNDELYKQYNSRILAFFPSAKAPEALRAVYTPLFGAGNLPVRDMLARAGFSGLRVVESQTPPDGSFPGLKTPNPEDFSAFALALKLARETSADIVFATDPDGDRIAACAPQNGEYKPLSGNELGALLCDYVMRNFAFEGAKTKVVFKTVVTGELGAQIARAHGATVRETLTGFKFIGELIERLGADERFAFAYEESCGYLATPLARDKDAVSSALLVCLAAEECRERGITLLERLGELYAQYGFRADALETLPLDGDAARYMNALRKTPPFADAQVDDYTNSINGLPSADLLKYALGDGSTVAVRPSGTEPLLKIYYSAVGGDMRAASARLEELKITMKRAVKSE